MCYHPYDMGDIYRKVRICGIDNGRKRVCALVTALFDTGSTMSVIGTELARRLGGSLLPRAETLENRQVDLMLASVSAKELDCGERRRPVVVDDYLAEKAGPRAQMILGSDYMQGTKMALLLSDDPKREAVLCRRRKSK